LEQLKQPVNILEFDVQNPEPALSKAGEVLSYGGTIAFPTESFYGLGVDATNEKAIKQIFELKLRSSDQPLLLLISSVDDLDKIVEEIPGAAGKLIKQFWPGGLTIVFKAAQEISPLITASTGKVGIRLSSHPAATALAETLGKPITGTSANISGQPACSTAFDVFESLGNKVNLILDGGKTQGSLGSTIIDVTVDPPRILREGMITREIIEKTIPIK